MSSPARKSARRRQPSKKYTVDAFEGLDIPDSVADSTRPAPIPIEDSGDDADFHADANVSPEPAEDELSNAGDIEREEPDELDDANTQAEEEYDNEEESVVGASDAEKPLFRKGKRKKPEWGKSKGGRAHQADPRFQPRGLLEPATRGSKEVQRLFMFGPTVEDQTPPLQGHFKWSAEPTLPSRNSSAGGFGGFTRSFSLREEAVKRESDEGWEWYDLEGGKESFSTAQAVSALDPAEGQTYMPAISTPPLKFAMGPFKDQRLYKLHVGSSMNLNEAFVPEAPSADLPTPSQDPRSVRNGWFVNLGRRVTSLDWVPNQKGPRQFLAISTLSDTVSESEEAAYEATKSPAFTPQPSYKASIQIWEFRADDDGRVDMQQPPQLRRVICTAWGELKSLKWCPAPRIYPESSETSALNLGLLASFWGDGAVRVLDVSISASVDMACEYVRYNGAALAIRPPNTVCSCFTWLSSTGIAVASANGTLGVWHIPSSIKATHMHHPGQDSQPSSVQSAEPVMYASLATTYILGIVSCYPSRPNMLLATTMAGHLFMLDLMDMSSNTTLSPGVTIRSTRTRIGRTILVWHDWSQMALSADDNFTLVAYPLRRFFRQIGCTRYKSPPMDVAVSPCHPFVLAGCAGGEVVSNNPLRRAYESKVPIWNQAWFRHEWRPLKADEALDDAKSGEDIGMEGAGPETDGQARERKGAMGSPPSSGICRILEGFKCDFVRLFNTEDSFAHRENGTIYTTVHELNSAVTGVVWNPNLHVGGWAAAGMASGLLRVEDISS